MKTGTGNFGNWFLRYGALCATALLVTSLLAAQETPPEPSKAPEPERPPRAEPQREGDAPPGRFANPRRPRRGGERFMRRLIELPPEEQDKVLAEAEEVLRRAQGG